MQQKIDDLVLACPNNSSGLRPRLAARPRPRLQSKDKHMKNISKIGVNELYLQSLINKIRPEVTTSLNKDITCCINNHAKNTSKYFKKTPQSDPKWLLFGAWEPPWTLCVPGSLITPKFDPSSSPNQTHLEAHGAPETQQDIIARTK